MKINYTTADGKTIELVISWSQDVPTANTRVKKQLPTQPRRPATEISSGRV